MSVNFWSGQQAECDLILHLALLISATIIATGMRLAPPSVKATVVAPTFSLLKQLEKQSCLSGFGGKERNLLLRFLLANINTDVTQPCMCPTALASQLGFASEVLHGARRMPGLQDGESSRKRSRPVAVLLREILRTLKWQQDLFKELRNPTGKRQTPQKDITGLFTGRRNYTWLGMHCSENKHTLNAL